eukprot:573738-Prymnesium_polylepis.1
MAVSAELDAAQPSVEELTAPLSAKGQLLQRALLEAVDSSLKELRSFNKARATQPACSRPCEGATRVAPPPPRAERLARRCPPTAARRRRPPRSHTRVPAASSARRVASAQTVDVSQLTVEASLFKSFDMIVRMQLEPVWHKVRAARPC